MSDVVQRDSAVLVHFIMRLEDGSVAESTHDSGKPALFRLGDGSLSEALELALTGLRIGDNKRFSLAAEAAFGAVNPNLIHYFSRRDFSETGAPEIGAIMLFSGRDGNEMPGVIRDISGDSITVDFNHPLAGQSVHFEIDVLAIDPALEATHANSSG